MKKFILPALFIILFSVVMVLSVRGRAGNPTDQELNSPDWVENGPFELSPERARFALLYSIIENKSLVFDSALAQFASPDVAIYNNQFVSLFAPGVSLMVIPGYLVGKVFGVSQVGTFAVVSIFALLNAFLVRAIAIRLGASKRGALFGALAFLFATPAFTYAVTLYQHHLSLFFILFSFYLLITKKGNWVMVPVWFLLGSAFLLDYPNLFLVLPIAFLGLSRLISKVREREAIVFNLKLGGLLTAIFILPPLLFLALFNQESYGSPTQLSGTLPRAIEYGIKLGSGDPILRDIGVSGSVSSAQDIKQYIQKKTDLSQKTAIGAFETRNMLNGIYIQFFSPDRGAIIYSPVILLGLLGLIMAYRKKVKYLYVLVGIAGIDVLLYSMWGDPWGGWAFGSRYLIPAYAVLGILLALVITYWKKHLIFSVIVLSLFIYSAYVNTAGALSSSKNPPQVEVLALEKITKVQQKYTFSRNLDYLSAGKSKSFIFASFAGNYMSASEYFIAVFGLIIVSGTFVLFSQWLTDKTQSKIKIS
ncbi:MAG: hypothetical protein Q7S03_03535 [bacterium]|nr:hypothetical protein [bacterium]